MPSVSLVEFGMVQAGEETPIYFISVVLTLPFSCSVLDFFGGFCLVWVDASLVWLSFFVFFKF